MTEEELNRLAELLADKLRPILFPVRHGPYVKDWRERQEWECPNCGLERITDSHMPNNFQNMCRCIRA